jgi:CSLREA domain-containing protein
VGLWLLAVLPPGSAVAQTTIFVVNSVADDPDDVPGDGQCATAGAACTLRAAIEEGFELTRDLRIEFALGSGTPTIQVGSSGLRGLPTLFGLVVIDGSSGGADRVELDGSMAGPGANGLEAAGTLHLYDMVINRFAGNGVALTGTPPPSRDHILQNNRIGTDAAGTPAAGFGNGCDGILAITLDSSIGGIGNGNVISSNGLDGIRISDGGAWEGIANNTVRGNSIGTDIQGVAALGNGSAGNLDAVNNLVGPDTDLSDDLFDKPDPGFVLEQNFPCVTSGLVGRTVTMSSGPAQGQTRRISAAAGNTVTVPDFTMDPLAGDDFVLGGDGVSIWGAAFGAAGNSIGGSIIGEGNLISGNLGHGVSITTADDNRVQNNIIGANTTRGAPLANGASGVSVSAQAQGSEVVGNKIEGNARHGVVIDGARLTEVLSNFIGSASLPNGVDGVRVEGGALDTLVSQNDIGNNGENGLVIHSSLTEGTSVTANTINGNEASGVVISDGAHFNVIGGLIAAAANQITGNLEKGIIVDGDTSDHNAILGNSIFGNGTQQPIPPDFVFLGIDLGDDDVTDNDAGDGDSGPNQEQNFPDLASAVLEGGGTTVAGSLDSLPNTTFLLEFFANGACDASGFGEGESHLGAVQVSTDGGGNASFDASLAMPAGGPWVSATATEMMGDLPLSTSEFSACVFLGGAVPGLSYPFTILLAALLVVTGMKATTRRRRSQLSA